ncbi:DIE2/ALG10 family protein [Apiospora aurea]|uniref:Dol-P-Glc:Glc(2)Man(9)GlcNAc(2)-PP-Dol alpha-1,2-glucosyltransferase n=1 Tax=Apiospora aurea TaxID=335848 RepID=A0ABR1QLZ0_9PEZI
MELLTEALDLVLSQKFLLLASSGVVAVALGRLCELNANVLVKFGLFNSILVSFAFIWLGYVNASVPSPYLDEFFHIPQTQVYCQGKYFQWDDKITTPPGLYLAAIAWARLVGKTDCSARTLRQFNVVAIFWTSLFATFCHSTCKGGIRSSALKSNFALHSGLNIAIFPVLFFFSGLFYTDVLSTCIVLAAYSNHSARVSSRSGPPDFLNDLYTIALGVCALCMRQTNVFWVVVYMGGLEAVAALKAFSPKYTPGHVYDPSVGGAEPEFFPWRYTLGEVYDPPVGDAWPGDLALCVLSLVCAAWWNLSTMLRRTYPHIITLCLFAAFVVWNGGVVLGDKSNHVATLHAAQMLYIWPLFAFFSAPLFLPQIVRCLDAACHLVTKSSPSSGLHLESSRRSEEKEAALKVFNAVFSNGPLLSALVVAACLVVGLMIVHFNTIIHPFTLADNRHYMFYVFRYSILRESAVRHALVPVYVFCGWLSWSALYDCKGPKPASNVPRITISAEDKAESFADRFAILNDEVSQSPSTSNVIILLLTTALSLMTAPLVEPRYFILPWVFWRLLVPAWSMDDLLGTQQTATGKPSSILLVRVFNRYDIRLVLESVWFLLINVATMYMFLTRPFYWKAEDGTLLDGGNVQRFMW